MAFDRYDPEDPNIRYYGNNLVVLGIEWETKVVHVKADSFANFFPNDVPELVVDHFPESEFPFMVVIPCGQCKVTTVFTQEEMESWYGKERLEELLGGDLGGGTFAIPASS